MASPIQANSSVSNSAFSLQPSAFGKADLHIHTSLSDGMMTIQQILDWVQERTELDVIAVTDHDDLEGGLRARELAIAGGYRFEVIPGIEVTTREGHLLALFLERPVRSLRSLDETTEEVRAQGGICVVPHPLSWLTSSVGERSLDRAMAYHDPGIAGIEVENPTIAGRVVYEKVKRLNDRRYRLGETGGSDAHFLPAIGTAYTGFPGKSVEDLKAAILAKQTIGIRPDEKPERIRKRMLIRQQGKSLVWLPAKRVRQTVERRVASLRT